MIVNINHKHDLLRQGSENVAKFTSLGTLLHSECDSSMEIRATFTKIYTVCRVTMHNFLLS